MHTFSMAHGTPAWRRGVGTRDCRPACCWMPDGKRGTLGTLRVEEGGGETIGQDEAKRREGPDSA